MENLHVCPVAMVTGATQYTGFATAKLFAQRGYDVCVTSRDYAKAENAAQRLSEMVPEAKFLPVQMDPPNVEETAAAFERVKKTFGRLDVFVANACAACRFKSILNTSEEAFDSIVNANLKGYFFGTQAAAKLMIETGSRGSIVLIGSVHSRGAHPNRIPYAISKGGIEVMARNCAYELGKYGIRVNCLVAGAIVNEKFLEQSEEEKEKRRANWPLGKESYPEDIAKSVYFLASDEAATITGTSLVVDSGVSACLLQYQRDWESIG
jgi:short-chain dehydrogenase/reductase SDR